MDESNKNSKGKYDPLLKLKEERDKLIKWSIQLKNNKTNFLGNGNDNTTDIKKEEHFSSSHITNLNDNRNNSRVRKKRDEDNDDDMIHRLTIVKRKKPLVIDSNDIDEYYGMREDGDADADQYEYEDEKEEDKENENENENQLRTCKVRIRGNIQQNNKNIHIHLKNAELDEQSTRFMSKRKLGNTHSSKNIDFVKSQNKLLTQMAQYEQNLKNEKRIYGDENEDRVEDEDEDKDEDKDRYKNKYTDKEREAQKEKNKKNIYGYHQGYNYSNGIDGTINEDKENDDLYGISKNDSNNLRNKFLNNYSCSEDLSDEMSSFKSVTDHIKKREQMKKQALYNTINSNDIVDEHKLEHKDKDQQKQKQTLEQKYNKKIYNIEIKKPICTNTKYDIKSKNKAESSYVTEEKNTSISTSFSTEQRKENNSVIDILSTNKNTALYSEDINSESIKYDGMKNKNINNRRKIMLRKRRKNKEKEADFTYIQTEKDINNNGNNNSNNNNNNSKNNRESNDSVNTFIPLGSSFLRSTPNSSSTTANSYGDIFKSNEANKKGTTQMENSKIAEAEKITNLLKTQVQTLEKKKENLNDKMNDLQDNVFTLMDKSKKDNLTVQHYELIIKSLETKYNKLFNMYQELDEHRTSYVDAYREKQTKIENLCACLQIKSEENLKMTQEINILNKKAEELQGQIYEYIKDLEDKEKQLNKKKEEIAKLKADILSLKNEITELKKQLEKAAAELNKMTLKYNSLQEEHGQLKEQHNLLQNELKRVHEFYQSRFDSLQALLKKVLCIFQLNNENVLRYAKFFKDNVDLIEEKLKTNLNNYDNIIELLDTDILMEPITDIVLEREEEYTRQKKEMENLFDNEFLKMHEKNLKNVELANTQIFGLKEKLSATVTQRDITKKRAILLSNGQGRLNDKSIISDLKKLHQGTLLYKCKYRTLTHKPVLIYMKIINNNQITWTKDTSGTKRFKKRKLIELKDIISIDYGITARPVYWHIEKQNQKKIKNNKIAPSEMYDNTLNINPYGCFTIYTKTRAYDFFSQDEDIIANWVIGLGRLCSQYTTNPNIQSRSEFIVKKVQLKLKLYCIKHGISYTTLWKRAIEKTRGTRTQNS